ncbi:hypothetical protein [Bacteroides helcogenes]|uniref:Uncharacterized protein n=1 Tax=Bacteroides helcogenes (strain ATCC 35417 / DSM 20613 / JCM 6297 / CCUG 15421 / P 36-108) TaxID=693979 RepID=E6SU90_BACT6|nr:hypothetical protein [Bacteroides helcogenes]ADV44363.1 hypothetical protein Bache_2396 [Bacteroides helcogenes P 36-108]
MDFKSPIDITAVLTAVRKHKDILKAVDKLDASEVLKHFTPIPGITDSIELGKVEGGTVSGKYIGTFEAGKSQGKVVPRRLIVRPVVMEMADEPERYRRTYIANVPGALRKEHPFELWLINHGHELASNDLLFAIFTAKYSAKSEDKDIEDAFDGLGTIISEAEAVGDISSVEGNVYATGEITRANVGEILLKMWRHMPRTFKRKKNIKMFISDEMGDLYDDWRKDEGTIVIGMKEDTSDTQHLLGSNNRCELVRLPNLPDGSQFVMLTTKENVCYGFDKESDFKSITPFSSGNPYKFTAAGKYLIGFQVVSVHKSEFCVNDRPLDPAGSNPFGYIQVTLSPDAAVNNGGKWRIKGEAIWRDSGTHVAVEGGKEYTIQFKDANGYTTPEEQTKTPASGKVEKVTGTYVVKD